MRLALDLDGTITRCPALFSILSKAFRAAEHAVFVITFRADRGFAEEDLDGFDIVYDELILPDAASLAYDAAHWRTTAAEWKVRECRRLGIDIVFDDMVEVVNALAGQVATVLMVHSQDGQLRIGPRTT